MELAIIGLVAIVLALIAASLVSNYASAAAQRRSANARSAEDYRKHRALSQPPPDAIVANKDPRHAAAILLYQTAAFKGDISDAMDGALLEGMETLFNADEDAAADLFSDAWRALGENNDTGVPLETLVAPIIEQCTDGERRAFLALLQRISTLEGAPNQRQIRLSDDLRRLLL
jgi:uncharacterized tellurite resistance protein B-like protein